MERWGRRAGALVALVVSTACGESFTSATAEDAGRDSGAGAGGSGGSAGNGGSAGAAGQAAHGGSGGKVDGAPLVLNEVDYDNPELDIAEFVEIRNVSASEQSLDGLIVVFVNGAAGMKTEYARVELSGTLPSKSFALIASTSVAGESNVLRFPFPSGGEENQIQNGGADGDAIGLVDVVDGRLIDALSYGGSVLDAQVFGVGSYDFVEGNPTTALDDGPSSLVRFPDGKDTNDAAADWQASSAPTPGYENQL